MFFGSIVTVGSVIRLKSVLRWRGSPTNSASSAHSLMSVSKCGLCFPITCSGLLICM